MTDVNLYIKLSSLPVDLKMQVEDFIEFLQFKAAQEGKKTKRVAGKAKGLISLKDNFDDPIEGFNEYMA